MPNEQTEKALDEITRWARELAAGGSPDGGVNIAFAIARQGSHAIMNAFLSEGDCTAFVPSVSAARYTIGRLRRRHRWNSSLRAHAALTKCRSLWKWI
jgi:hypothetical protein